MIDYKELYEKLLEEKGDLLSRIDILEKENDFLTSHIDNLEALLDIRL
jgi:hypothetical protein